MSPHLDSSRSRFRQYKQDLKGRRDRPAGELAPDGASVIGKPT